MERLDAGCLVSGFVLWGALAIGWILNIAKFAGHANDPLTALEVIRGFAIFLFPIGCVLGWF